MAGSGAEYLIALIGWCWLWGCDGVSVLAQFVSSSRDVIYALSPLNSFRPHLEPRDAAPELPVTVSASLA